MLVWLGHPTLAALRRVHQYNVQAQMRYVPSGTYGGTLHLFRAEKQPQGDYVYDPHYGWSKWTSGKVEITKEADFNGEIRARSISVEDGAMLKAVIELERESQIKAVPEPKAKAVELASPGSQDEPTSAMSEGVKGSNP